MNKIMLLGNITRDPEIRYTQSANPKAYALFGIAVRRQFAKSGEPDTDFFNLIAWGPKAEFVEKYVRKGGKFLVVGRVELNVKEDANRVKQTYVNVVVEECHFAESKTSSDSRLGSSNPMQPTVQDDDDDLPF